MKKFLLAASLLIAGASFAGYYNVSSITIGSETEKGRHISPSQVPAPVMATFNAKYPTATGTQWQVEREHGQIRYQADFMLNGVRIKAYFSADGTFLGQRIK